MKYFLSCTVAVCLAILCQVTAQNPQKPVYKKLDLASKYRVGLVSPNGNFIIGSSAAATYDIFCYNTGTDEVTYIYEEDQTGASANGVTDDGLIVGSYGKKSENKPAIWKDGTWELLPVPDPTTDQTGTASGISSDKKIIAGYFGQSPCYWELTDGQYVYNELPHEKIDWNGQKPQWITAYGVSSDGSRVYGAIMDKRGFVPLPTIWIRNNKGTYDTMRTLCIDVCLNSEFLPGPSVMPVYEDYVTAPQGTPEFDEQRAKWDEVWKEYSEEYNKCKKDTTVTPQNGFISPDGKDLILSMKMPYRDPANPRINAIFSPIRVEIATDRVDFYKTTDENGKLYSSQMQGYLTDKEGNLFATATDGGAFYSTVYVYPTSDSTPVEFCTWLKEKYDLDVAEDMTYNVLEKDTVLTGFIRISATGNMIAGSSSDPNTRKFTSYTIKLFETSGINESILAPVVTLYAKEGTIYLSGEAESITISDLSGKKVYSNRVVGNQVNVGQLQKGIYLVGLDTASGKQFHKIILN